ncbi:MAG: ABC transporter substrate-binding protein, partial [Elusimicrobia bacterium]|nr:ABC transporter substrate-binding protein [Elusimicrobiota bacterium]
TITHNSGSEIRKLACEMLRKNVESLNPKFRIDIRGVDWPSFLEKTQARKMPLFARSWSGDYPDPHNFVFPFLHSKGRYPVAQGYSNPKIDELIDKAMTEVSQIKRKKLYDRIQTMGYEDAVQVYVACPRWVYAIRSWLKGYVDNAAIMGPYFYTMSKEL